MESIEAELDVIRLLEKELNNREESEFKYQLNRLKDLAHTIERMIKTEESDYEVHKATNILCQDLGILWRNVFNVKE